MAVRFWRIYEETRERFRLEIKAGKAGMDNVVSWVHMIEDETIVSRFQGEELAITTGMKASQPNWLMNLIQEMAKDECAGIIINTGKYLMGIPQDVIDWCEEHKFPLLEMPWEISITSLIQDYCTRIIDQNQDEKRLSNAFMDIIQGRGLETEIKHLLEQRFDMAGTFQVFCISVRRSIDELLNFNHAVLKLENLFGLWKGNNKINVSYGLIRAEDSFVLILNNIQNKYLLELPDLIMQSFIYFTKEHRFFLGIGPSITGIEKLPVSYKRARTAMKMSMETGKEIVKFEEMGFYKLLFSIDDPEILLTYADEILGSLERYDKMHNSNYIETLRSYIKNDRSLIRVAEDTYSHRNTVNYRIQNIKRIVGNELKDAKDLFPYQVAFYISDMVKKEHG